MRKQPARHDGGECSFRIRDVPHKYKKVFGIIAAVRIAPIRSAEDDRGPGAVVVAVTALFRSYGHATERRNVVVKRAYLHRVILL